MSKPNIHAESSARKWGGTADEYLKFHEWFDQTKAHFPDMRHRAILHSSLGIYLLAQVFGDYFVNSVGKTVSTRNLGEQHILEDMGGKYIPTVQDYLEQMEYKEWMGGKGYPPSHEKIEKKRKNKVVSILTKELLKD